MPLFQISYFQSVNQGTIPRFITGTKLNIWENSLYICICPFFSVIANVFHNKPPFYSFYICLTAASMTV